MTGGDTSAFEARITGGWDLGSLPDNVRVGQDAWIEHVDTFERYRSTQDPGLVLGDRVRINTWTRFTVDPTGMVEIGDDCHLVGPIFMCAERITVGPRTLISYHVTIADSDFHPTDPELRRQDALANAPDADGSIPRPEYVTAPVTIGADARVGIGAIILKGVTVGDGAVIGAGSVVTRDVPARGHMVGNPGRLVEG